MVVTRDSTRIDTLQLKSLIYQKIGHQRAEEYFENLRRFLCSNLSKADFDKSCIRTFGRENIHLHNRLIRAIIQNSNLPKPPPQRADKVEGLGVGTGSVHQKSCFQSLCSDGLLTSPRRCRSLVIRDRKLRDRDRSSPLGPLGKSLSLTYEETLSRIQEQSAAELHSISSKPPQDVVAPVEEGEEVEQISEIPSEWRSITAPFGVSVKSGSTRKTPHFRKTCQSSGELPDTASLKSRLEKKLASEGLSISLEGANAVNRGLNAFVKRMLENCIPFGRSHHRDPQHFHLMQQNGQLLPGSNGISQQTHSQMQPQTPHLNMLHFRLAMETNPTVLGENWPSQLENISHNHLFQ